MATPRRRTSPLFVFLLSAIAVGVSVSLSSPSWSSASASASASSQRLMRIGIRDSWFVDEWGRAVLFRGVNAVRKSFPWTPYGAPVDVRNASQLANLRRWGFNVVRLGLMWSGLMPDADRVNATYLAEMVRAVDTLAAHGLYTIVDLHQDMLSSQFGSYDGVPRWLLARMPASRSRFPWPLRNATLNASVFAAYVTESCGFQFQCLYDNVNGFADEFARYWSLVSAALADRTAVLGYELLNEPWAGDIYADPLLLLPGVAGRRNLLPLYDRAYAAIARNDAAALIFYEPVTWGVLFNQNYFGSGFARPPGNSRDRTVLAWHYYCWLLQFNADPLEPNGTYPKLDKFLCDDVQLEASFAAVRLDLLKLGSGPSFLTEFGVCAYRIVKNKNGSDNDDSDNDDNAGRRYNTDECEYILRAADKYLQSWTYWDSDFYTTAGHVDASLVRTFSRVYPVATNGVPHAIHFNATSRRFVYLYAQNGSALDAPLLAPTEIFVPEHVYPEGFRVIVSNHLRWTYDRASSKVFVFLAGQEDASLSAKFASSQDDSDSVRSHYSDDGVSHSLLTKANVTIVPFS